jgi:DNA-3-methyladenine glycosylase
VSPGLGDLSGPGRLCRAFQLTRADDGTDLVGGPVRLLPRDRPRGPVVRGPRVGLRRARERPLRFAIADSPWVSRPRPGAGTGSRA